MGYGRYMYSRCTYVFSSCVNSLCTRVMLSFMVCLEPNSPTGLQVTDFGTTFVDFEWNAADSKRYMYECTSTARGETIFTDRRYLTGTFADITDLIPGTTYDLEVVARINRVASDAASTSFTLSMCANSRPGISLAVLFVCFILYAL